jgi:xylulokinase
MAIDQAPAVDLCPEPALLAVHEPDVQRHAWFDVRRRRFASLYQQLEPCFPAAA